MTVLVDSNLTPLWVGYLQAAGIDAVHWWSVGKGDAPDEELLEWAAERNTAILTGDGDFSQMLALRRLSGPSVIFLRTSERNPQGPGDRVIEAYKAISERMEGLMIVTIDDRSIRRRELLILIDE